MSVRVFAALCAALFCSALYSPLVAAATQTYDYCFQETDPQNAECKAYIAGFLDGAVITDAAIVDSLVPEDLSPAALGYVSPPPTFYADFCLPDTDSVQQATGEILRELDATKAENLDMSATVYEIVKRVFPCS